ncbi:MAG: dockerin type I repeat-containing protein, partial [Planctomycetota bacterium]|nr:dockerin type I repeat-containing protein [Planctomycetota bacterium]
RCTISGSFGLPFLCLQKPIELAVCRLGGDSTVRDTRFCDYSESPIAGAWVDRGGNSFNPAGCNAADLNGDGRVDGADLARILARWGQSCLGCAADLNRDGEVNGADLAGILAGWG